jgi:hypothetical protein
LTTIGFKLLARPVRVDVYDLLLPVSNVVNTPKSAELFQLIGIFPVTCTYVVDTLGFHKSVAVKERVKGAVLKALI